MKILSKTGTDEIATVYVAELDSGKKIEFVESVQPPIPLEKKWVLLISTLDGCPIECRFCDAGGYYNGKLTKEEIFTQIEFLINKRFPDKKVPVEKFKIQFARMGEPSFNLHVIDVLKELPTIYHAPGLLPSLSTIAPTGCDRFFEELLHVKKDLYDKRFQLQFSIHSTNNEKRDWLIPVKKWDFQQISSYGKDFYSKDGRKITLNFALAEESEIDPDILLDYFDPSIFLIKITPVNPTFKAIENNISSHILPEKEEYEIINKLQDAGYEVLLSIGELMENHIGSNCGQYITNYLKKNENIDGSYTYPLSKINE